MVSTNREQVQKSLQPSSTFFVDTP